MFLWVENASKLVNSCLLIIKALKIQDGCQISQQYKSDGKRRNTLGCLDQCTCMCMYGHIDTGDDNTRMPKLASGKNVSTTDVPFLSMFKLAKTKCFWL